MERQRTGELDEHSPLLIINGEKVLYASVLLVALLYFLFKALTHALRRYNKVAAGFEVEPQRLERVSMICMMIL